MDFLALKDRVSQELLNLPRIFYKYLLIAWAGTGGTESMCPQDFVINKEVSFLFSGIAPLAY